MIAQRDAEGVVRCRVSYVMVEICRLLAYVRLAWVGRLVAYAIPNWAGRARQRRSGVDVNRHNGADREDVAFVLVASLSVRGLDSWKIGPLRGISLRAVHQRRMLLL